MINSILHLKTKEERFWDWFQVHSDLYLSMEGNQDWLFHELKQRLSRISRCLTFEFSPLLENGKREFIISADGIKRFFPAVIRLVKSAPPLPKWNIIAFRQPKSGFEEIKYKSIHLRLEDVYFRYGRDSGKLGIELHIKGFRDQPDWIIVSFLLLDMILGEYDTEMSISWIDRKAFSYGGAATLFPISDLPKTLQDYKKEAGREY